MKLKTGNRFFGAALLVATASSTLAAVRYVDVSSTNAMTPFTSWATAAGNIQDAVDVSMAGDEIVVTNGVYGALRVSKPLSLRSVNGAPFTIIDGAGVSQCADLIGDASLSGFTLTHGRELAGAGAFGGTLND